jgi:parallel beta-helix repeat protein
METLTLRNITVQQTLGLRPNGPGMGIRIFESRNVLFDGLVIRHSMVSGLQITTSEHVIIRNSRFEENSCGLEVENDYFVDVHDNVMTRNATGVMFLDMPSYPHTGGHALRAFRNRIHDNNGPTAAPGIARTARPGTGVLIMGGEYDIHLFDNQITENGHAAITLIALPWQIDNPKYNAVPNDVVVRNNVFGRSGFAPLDNLAAVVAAGEPLADVIWDGATTFIAANQVKTAEPLRLTLNDNVRIDGRPVTFLSLGLTIANGGMLVAEPTRTLPAGARTSEPPAVKLPQDQQRATE